MSEPINVAVIGLGNFARNTFLPIIKENKKYNPYAACDLKKAIAEEICKQHGMARCTTEYKDLLKDENIGLVAILTRHDKHAEIAIAAAQAGKHVYCEKPMGLNIEECRNIALAVQEAEVTYCVGHNRGLAQFVLEALELIKATRNDSLIKVYHRMQSYVPPDSWLHGPEGGGRLIGEGIHAIGLVCLLAGKKPVSVYAEGGIYTDPVKVNLPDTGVITIGFEDGSIGIVDISSVGNPMEEKEETFVDYNGRTIRISNFKKMKYCGFGSDRRTLETIESVEMDKGHSTQMDMLADAITKGTKQPNGVVEGARAVLIAELANKSILAGGKKYSLSAEDYVF